MLVCNHSFLGFVPYKKKITNRLPKRFGQTFVQRIEIKKKENKKPKLHRMAIGGANPFSTPLFFLCGER